MKLPPPIQAYFDADRERGGQAPTHVFATDALVKDEGKTHIGRTAIAAWWGAAKTKYAHTAEPREVSEAGKRITVLAEVTGTFPGSPATLNFMFTLRGNAITALEIGA